MIKDYKSAGTVRVIVGTGYKHLEIKVIEVIKNDLKRSWITANCGTMYECSSPMTYLLKKTKGRGIMQIDRQLSVNLHEVKQTKRKNFITNIITTKGGRRYYLPKSFQKKMQDLADEYDLKSWKDFLRFID